MKKVFNIKETKMDEAEITVGEFFINLLHAATNAHILHLRSRSYSEHMALGGLYEALPDLVDAVIEGWQGKNSQLIEYPNTYFPPVQGALSMVQGLSDYVQANRAVIGSDSELQNDMDAIQSLIDSTIYKLTFLK